MTGEENLLHMHRLRALCDAVIVGAGTIAADDLAVRRRDSWRVPARCGSSSIPPRRLTADHRVFNDDSAETLYVCAESLIRPGEREFGRAVLIGLPEGAEGRVDIASLMRLLRARGCARVFVEGGGVTVLVVSRGEPSRPPARHRRTAADRERPSGDPLPAARRPRRLPSAALPRVPHGGRRAVRPGD